MTKYAALLLILLLSSLLFAQQITNVRVTQDEIGIYKIYFDLSGNSNDVYNIILQANSEGKTITPTTIGNDVVINPGKDRLIVWDPILDGVKKDGWKISLSAKCVSLPMVFVSGGTFTMGDTFGDGESDEQPTHQVTVGSFYIGKYEVTQKQWQDVMGSNPSYFKSDKLPVEKVSWYDCIEFCNKLSQREGLTPSYTIDKNSKDPNNDNSNDTYKWTVTCNWNANGYRLPTEAEWEYAAKGGNKSRGYKYSGSNTVDDVGWYGDNSNFKTHPVGTKQANELGIYDMSGNVYEWCWDWYDDSYYSKSPASNPQGAGAGFYRSLRGGAWNYDPINSLILYRGKRPPDRRDNCICFRLCKAI